MKIITVANAGSDGWSALLCILMVNTQSESADCLITETLNISITYTHIKCGSGGRMITVALHIC